MSPRILFRAKGYALRFARISRIRDDKDPSEIDTIQTIEEEIYMRQKTGGAFL